jgi:hypothetical protein
LVHHSTASSAVAHIQPRFTRPFSGLVFGACLLTAVMHCDLLHQHDKHSQAKINRGFCLLIWWQRSLLCCRSKRRNKCGAISVFHATLTVPYATRRQIITVMNTPMGVTNDGATVYTPCTTHWHVLYSTRWAEHSQLQTRQVHRCACVGGSMHSPFGPRHQARAQPLYKKQCL